MYKGARMVGPLNNLQKMQRRACLWITSTFKMSPNRAAETLTGIPPIHLHVKKLVEQSHVRSRVLQASHAFCWLISRNHKFSVETLHARNLSCKLGKLVSPVVEAWANLGLSSLDLDPVHSLNQPGKRPKDIFPGWIVYDIVTPPPKGSEHHKELMKDRNSLLKGAVDAASHSPWGICIITDVSTPPAPMQSVAVYCAWHAGDLYNDWFATGLSISDDAELQVITEGIQQASNIGLEDIHDIHIFSDSTNALRHSLDASHHSGQVSSLRICEVLLPWLQHHTIHKIHLHPIGDGVEIKDHQLAHIHAVLTCIEAGGSPVISANFVQHGVVTCMLNGWKSLFQSRKYIGSHFLILYAKKDTPLSPTHVNSGPWMCKTGHSHALTACLVHCITGHAPIGEFHARFFKEESTACRCGLLVETAQHVLYTCPHCVREDVPKQQLCHVWLVDFLMENESTFVFNVS